jgi:hypothetical protein
MSDPSEAGSGIALLIFRTSGAEPAIGLLGANHNRAQVNAMLAIGVHDRAFAG